VTVSPGRNTWYCPLFTPSEFGADEVAKMFDTTGVYPITFVENDMPLLVVTDVPFDIASKLMLVALAVIEKNKQKQRTKIFVLNIIRYSNQFIREATQL